MTVRGDTTHGLVGCLYCGTKYEVLAGRTVFPSQISGKYAYTVVTTDNYSSRRSHKNVGTARAHPSVSPRDPRFSLDKIDHLFFFSGKEHDASRIHPAMSAFGMGKTAFSTAAADTGMTPIAFARFVADMLGLQKEGHVTVERAGKARRDETR